MLLLTPSSPPCPPPASTISLHPFLLVVTCSFSLLCPFTCSGTFQNVLKDYFPGRLPPPASFPVASGWGLASCLATHSCFGAPSDFPFGELVDVQISLVTRATCANTIARTPALQSPLWRQRAFWKLACEGRSGANDRKGRGHLSPAASPGRAGKGLGLKTLERCCQSEPGCAERERPESDSGRQHQSGFVLDGD